MKKIFLIILVLFFNIDFVFGLEDGFNIKLISVTNNTVTIRIDTYDNDSLCYLYRSTDKLNYDVQMIIDCNSMYVDENLESDMTYYYKAKVGNSELSDIIEIKTEPKIEYLNITRDVNMISNTGIGFVCLFGLSMIIVLSGMYMFKKDLNN